MNVSILLAHPNSKSFNHAIANRAREVLERHKHRVFFHDLYDEGFDPILPYEEFEEGAELPGDIRIHCDEIASSDGIVVVHPNWWGQPPAILKGWIDRVIRPGIAYRFLEGDDGEGIPLGLLKAKAGLVFNTSNTPTEREMNVFGDPLETLWKNCIFDLCGVKMVHREMFNVIVTSTSEERQAWLTRVEQIVQQFFP